MILLNRIKEYQDVILTLSELSNADTFNLNLKSPNDELDIELKDDASNNPARYNRYIIPTTMIMDLQLMVIYKYTVTDVDGNIIETGTAKVIDTTPEEKVVYVKDDEEVIIYKRG